MGVLKGLVKSPRPDGQGLIEFAISLVVLMILVAGIVDGGRALFTYMALRDAAQEGALYGSIEPYPAPAIEDRLKISSDFAEDMAATLQVTISFNDGAKTSDQACLGDEITVTVLYPDFPVTMPFIGIFVGNDFDISASISDTVLQPGCP
jgi:hypothetical protein